MAKRRAHGEGTIYQRSDGRWTAKLTIGYRNGKPRKKYLYGKTQKEVQRKLFDLRRSLESGRPPADDKTTVGELMERWITTKAPVGLAPSTVANYEYLNRCFITPTLGHIPIARLSPTDVDGMVSNIKQRELSSSLQLHAVAVLNRALRWAVHEGWVPQNPVERMESKPTYERESERRSLRHEELAPFRQACAEHAHGLIFELMLAIGIRPGEALALRWAAIDHDPWTVRIEASLRRTPSGLALGPPKTKKSRRAIVIPPVVVEPLKRHRRVQAEQQLAVGDLWQDNGLVFATKLGGPISPNNLRRSLRKVCEDAGIAPLRPHELRHSFVSLLADAGVPGEKIAGVTGHQSARITEVYTHELGDRAVVHLDTMDRILGAAEPGGSGDEEAL